MNGARTFMKGGLGCTLRADWPWRFRDVPRAVSSLVVQCRWGKGWRRRLDTQWGWCHWICQRLIKDAACLYFYSSHPPPWGNGAWASWSHQTCAGRWPLPACMHVRWSGVFSMENSILGLFFCCCWTFNTLIFVPFSDWATHCAVMWTF